MKLEVCCGDLASVLAARDGGADRVELCEHLELDGITPSDDLIRQAVATGIRVHVLIRPRSGDFVYNEEEVCVMEASIRRAIRLGGKAVVIGALCPSGDIDIASCQRLVAAARDEDKQIDITFHRAFDVCRDPLLALRQISELGCNRLLTSGQAATAPEGCQLLRQLVKEAIELPHPIIIMAGSGVTPDNVATLVAQTGVNEVHGSLRSLVNGSFQTTVDAVRRTLQAIQ